MSSPRGTAQPLEDRLNCLSLLVPPPLSSHPNREMDVNLGASSARSGDGNTEHHADANAALLLLAGPNESICASQHLPHLY